MRILIIIFLITLIGCKMGDRCSQYNATFKAIEFNIKIDSLWHDAPNRTWVFENTKENKKFVDGSVYELFRVANKGDRIVKEKNSLIIMLYKNDSKDSGEIFRFECLGNTIFYNDRPTD